ncbi:MATE family efflux transporter [Halobacteriales archaeon QH_10_67_22]|nr:MAG: MATE family efflux transporter [Halobacteriales archaeon QH_10_67_22]
MTTGSVGPRLFSLAWPLVAGNLLQTAYNIADLFWVGRVSAEAVAAVSLMFPTTWLFVSVAIGLTAAANAVVSQHIGAGNERRAEHAVAQSVLLALAVAGFLSTFGLVIREPLVALIGAEGAVFDAAVAYIEVIFLAIPFTFLFFVFRSSLRAAGDTKTAMWLVATSAGLNIVIDPVFILEWGPFLGLGARGAAIATFISRGLAAALGLYVLVDGGWGIRLRLADLRPDVPVLRRLVDVGYPATLDGLTRSLAAVVFVAFVARFGAVATAAYGVGIRLMSVSWTVSGAVGQAAATGVGQNLGAGRPDRAARVTWTGTAGAMAVLFAAGALVFAVPGAVVRAFIADPAVVEAGVDLLRIIAPFWAFLGGLLVVQGGFRGAGQTNVAFVLSVLSRWVFRVPVAVLLAYDAALNPVDVNGLWWALAASSVVTFVIGVVWFHRGSWQDVVIEDRDGSTPTDTDGAESGREPTTASPDGVDTDGEQTVAHPEGVDDDGEPTTN